MELTGILLLEGETSTHTTKGAKQAGSRPWVTRVQLSPDKHDLRPRVTQACMWP